MMAQEPAADSPNLLFNAYRQAKSAEDTHREADYIEALLEISVPARLLDVPCGAGRIAIDLARRGYRVTGVDVEAALLADASATAAQNGLGSAFTPIESDMRSLPDSADFDGAYCWWESFGYFDDTGNLTFLRAVAAALKPGARFVLDTHVAESLLPVLHGRGWAELDSGLTVLERRDYDPPSGTAYRQYLLIQDGRVERHEMAMRLYTYREMVGLMLGAGFSACSGYNLFTTQPFSLGTGRAVMVATR